MLLKQIDPDVLSLLSALIAIDLTRGMDLEEQNVFGNFIVAVGSIMLTMAAAEEARKKALEDAKAKAEEAKTGDTAAAEKAPAKTAEKPSPKPVAKDEPEDEDIMIGRAAYAQLRNEQELLGRRMHELERLVSAQSKPGK